MEVVLIKLQALITFSLFRRRMWEEVISAPPILSPCSHELPSDGSNSVFRVHLGNIQNNNLGTLVNYEGPSHADMGGQVLKNFLSSFIRDRGAETTDVPVANGQMRIDQDIKVTRTSVCKLTFLTRETF